MTGRSAEDTGGLLRVLAPQVLGALVRRYGHFDTAEDAVQEALLAAAQQWPGSGMPANPRAWLITVAARRLTDLLRAEHARQRREETAARRMLPGDWLAPSADHPAADSDDSLVPISSRPPSRPGTTRHPARRRPTGRRSSPCTRC